MAFHNITVFYCTDIYIYIWYRMIWLLSDLSLHIITIQISISPHSWRWKITVKCGTCVRRLPSLQSRSHHSFSEEQHQSRAFWPHSLRTTCWTSATRLLDVSEENREHLICPSLLVLSVTLSKSFVFSLHFPLIGNSCKASMATL